MLRQQPLLGLFLPPVYGILYHMPKKKGVFALQTKKIFLALSALLAVVLLLAACGKLTMKNPLKKPVIYPEKHLTLSKVPLTLQKLSTPEITVSDQDKILNFFVQNTTYYLAMRSADNNAATLQAFDSKDTVLTPQEKFGEKGIFTIKAKMLLGIARGIDGTLYYIKDGAHVYKNGNDIVSFKGKTTATKVLPFPGEHQAYFYGNDNFNLVDIKDDAFENKRSGFLDNRAAPFRGGLNLLQLTNDGSIYGGGRLTPNGLSVVSGFNNKGKFLKQYGSSQKVAKDAINNLVDMAILDSYVCVIDGFNLKVWRKDGTYLGNLNVSDLLGDNLNAGKLTVVNKNTLGILGYLRNSQTKLVDIQLFTLTFPETTQTKK